jgi:diguanylate cyclase (GGDEF)-like protein/PAS domain S-box-containing protein
MATFVAGLALQRRYSRKVEEGGRQLRALTDNVPAAIAHIGRDERYRLANAQLASMVGREVDQIIGRSVHEVRGPIYERIKPYIDAALRGEEVRFESTDSGRGVPGHFDTVFVPDRGKDGSVLGFYSLTFDVTDLANAKAELGRLARIDSLTGIANRRYFEERLESTLAHARRTGRGLAVLAMDLDRFKAVNDEHGHAIGDAVLREYARRVLACVRRDDFFARLGGDEFVLLVEEPPAIAGEVIARKLLQAMATPFEIEGLSLQVGTSIGIAFGDGWQPAAELMERADQALYAAKNAGRGTFSLASRPPASREPAERRSAG